MTPAIPQHEPSANWNYETTTAQASGNHPTGVPRIALAERAQGFVVAEDAAHSLAISALATVPVFFAIMFAGFIIVKHLEAVQ